MLAPKYGKFGSNTHRDLSPRVEQRTGTAQVRPVYVCRLIASIVSVGVDVTARFLGIVNVNSE